jgi:two-component system, OmpR family, response regulator ChvI
MNPRQKENGFTLNKDDVVSSMRTANYDTSITKGNRILLVDDEMDIISVYKEGLSRDGFRVEGYSDPEKALLDFKPGAYDLVILDIRMPKMNGFELCREIRKQDDKVKICFLTAFEIQKTEFEKVLPSIKVNGFIAKPVHIGDLYSTVQEVLSNSKAGYRHNHD